MTNKNNFWSELTKGRQKAVETLPNILKFPIVRDRIEVLKKIVKRGDSLLDMGASDHTLERQLKEGGLNIKYSSFDVDRNFNQDFYELREIKGSFDVITSFEVIEHISPAEIMDVFRKAKEHLKKGGYFIISTPNVCHPVLFWRDCTHITPVRYDEVYGFYHALGFSDIHIYRAGKTKWKDRVWAFIYRPLLKLLRLDYIRHIIVVGKKG